MNHEKANLIVKIVETVAEVVLNIIEFLKHKFTKKNEGEK